jgi:glycosyltransferase involved in cell wall biosynthesis
MISVCLALYNGEKHIIQQIESILKELSQNDELIIFDDCSSDNSYNIVKNIIDSRIKLFRNSKNIGVNGTFQNAIKSSSGDYIFLSDQDDIWIKGRVKLMIDSLNKGNDLLVVSNYKTLKNSNEITYNLSLRKKDSKKTLKNIMRIFFPRSGYLGCVMLFRKNLVKYIIPIPKYIESHDLWIAMSAIIQNKIHHIEEFTLLRREHGGNFSLQKRPFSKKVISRLILFVSLLNASVRYLKL